MPILLTRAENLIAKRKERIKALDDLLKSTFLEMFCEYFNSNGFKPFGDFIDGLTDYHANGCYESLREKVELLSTPEYALMVRIPDLENNNFINECNYITLDAYNFLSKSKVFGGEIIINKIGSAGKVNLMLFLNIPVSMVNNAFPLRLSKKLNRIYAFYVLTSEFGTNAIQNHAKGAVTKTITKDTVRSIEIPIPPIELQNQFENLVEKVRIVKVKYTQSIASIEVFYTSLSQRAFMGELDLKRFKTDKI